MPVDSPKKLPPPPPPRLSPSLSRCSAELPEDGIGAREAPAPEGLPEGWKGNSQWRHLDLSSAVVLSRILISFFQRGGGELVQPCACVVGKPTLDKVEKNPSQAKLKVLYKCK